MRTGIVRSLTCAAAVAVGTTAYGQGVTSRVVTAPDGTQYQETTRVTPRSIPTTRYEERSQKVYRPQVSTDYQTYQQNYLTPVVEYRWVSRMHGIWNPFAQPYWTHNLEPFTRWETRPGTVQVPVARTDWVEETRTAQVPITEYRTVNDETVTRTAISVPPAANSMSPAGGTSIAARPQGQALQSDPPRQGSPWTNNLYSGGQVR
jgi:hypothetical protein